MDERPAPSVKMRRHSDGVRPPKDSYDVIVIVRFLTQQKIPIEERNLISVPFEEIFKLGTKFPP